MLDDSVLDGIGASVKTWDRAAVQSDVQQADELRKEYVARFPISSWPVMPVESYALGQTIEGGTVCWWLEFHTRDVASMSGGSSGKHLVFFGSVGAWRYPKQYGSVAEAWAAIRAGFVEMFDFVDQKRFDEIDSIKALVGAGSLRAKALYMYFPDEFLPVCSTDHVQHFLRTLGQDPSELSRTQANRRLLAVLRAVPELAEFSTQELGYFIYHWADPRSSVRVVKIAPGEGASEWQDCLAGSYICIGWDDVGDLSGYADKDAFRAAFRERYPYDGQESQVTRKSNELWTLMDLEPGDKVIANRGVSKVLAVGTVNNVGYVWNPDRAGLQHTLGVDWDTSLEQTIEPEKRWAFATVSKVSPALLKTILGASATVAPSQVDPVYLDVEAALHRRGQVIVYGPPGTGKTFTARRAAVWFLDGGSTNPAAAEVLENDRTFDVRERSLSVGRARTGQIWFMVANPNNWSWSTLFREKTVDYSLGRLKRNFPNVRAGDLVIGYESSPVKRVVALARVTSEYDPDASDLSALRLEPVAEVKDGVTYEELQGDSTLAASEPARFRCQGTLFALTTGESDRMLSLLIQRDPSIAAVAEPSVQRLTRVTFHPSYTYEDFTEGFRPTQSGTGTLELALTDGVFKTVCAAAAADPGNPYVVLIDEINRGNIPKIFGELITLIEKDKRGLTVRLPQSGTDFAVPPNVYIIGTMNTADRSIHLLDTALRRRFSFIELLPDSELLEGATAGALQLDLFLDSLNANIRKRVGREKQVGHAMFLSGGKPIDSAEAFAAIFRFELLPLLQEYLYDDYRELETLLGPIIDAEEQRVSALADDPETLCLSLANHLSAATSI